MVKTQDSIVIWISYSKYVATICFSYSNFAVYVDMGTLAGDTATLNFAFGGDASNRAWEVKVSQVPCAARYA